MYDLTQNKQSRAKDEKVGWLESMLSGPQRYQQHPCGCHAQARVQDNIGRPGQKTRNTWCSLWWYPDYLVFSRSSFLLMFAAARFDSSLFNSFKSTSGTETWYYKSKSNSLKTLETHFVKILCFWKAYGIWYPVRFSHWAYCHFLKNCWSLVNFHLLVVPWTLDLKPWSSICEL